MAQRKYGKATTLSDIGNINNKIRAKVRKAGSRSKLRTLLNESRYLYTLSNTGEWVKNFWGKVPQLRNKIKSEYHKTAVLANKRAKQIGTKPNFDTKID